MIEDSKEILSQKLQAEQATYSDDLVEAMLDNIGHPDSELRDEIIFSSFAKGFEEERFQVSQFAYLAKTLLDRDLLRFGLGELGEKTLTRSFSFLLSHVLLSSHYKPNGLYSGLLTESELTYFKEVGLSYLLKEKDLTAFSEDYGWIHATAHFSDYYALLLCYEPLKEAEWESFLNQLELFFKRVKKVFTAGEPERLAQLIYSPYLVSQLKHELFLSWLQNLNFSKLAYDDYMAYLNFSHFLGAVYLELDRKKRLDETLKELFYAQMSIFEQ